MHETDGSTVVSLVQREPTYEPAQVKDTVRQALHLADDVLDRLIEPGQTVFIKPNLIAAGRSDRPEEWEQIITHPAIIEAVLDEVATRLRAGRIIIGDAPQTDSDFSAIRQRLQLDTLLDRARTRWPEIAVEVMDLRREWWVQKGNVTVKRVRLPGDPRGSVRVDLGQASEFRNHDNNHQYYGADYDFADTRAHHSGGRHEYLVSRSVLEADLFINLPKLKTHKKAGVTLSLKNLVGINADKNYLPHYSLRSPGEGGDEYPEGGLRRRLESRGSSLFKRLLTMSGGTAPVWGPLMRGLGVRAFGPTSRVIRSGNWWGNDTVWRMCLDLNKILLWYDGSGARRSEPKPYLSLVDGIIAGQGDGPASADPHNLGVVVVGTDPFAVDLVCTRAMGFDWQKIPILRHAADDRTLPIGTSNPHGVRIRSNVGDAGELVSELKPLHYFRPHFGWRGHIELDEVLTGSPADPIS
jgi:uncharacterized protein (DUF362 family)